MGTTRANCLGRPEFRANEQLLRRAHGVHSAGRHDPPSVFGLSILSCRIQPVPRTMDERIFRARRGRTNARLARPNPARCENLKPDDEHGVWTDPGDSIHERGTPEYL